MSFKGIPLKVIIFILGSGDFARELDYYIQALAKHGNSALREDSVPCFVELDNSSLRSYHNKISSLPATNPYCSIIGSDDVETRYEVSQSIVEPYMGFQHNSVNIAGAKLGKGSIIMPGVTIGPGAIFGAHVLCKANSTIGANVQIGECSVVNQGAIIGAGVKIGERVHIGAGAIIKENLLIGDNVVINIGEIVTQNKNKTGENYES